MAIAFLTVLGLIASVVAGFLVYGMFLGLARFGRLIAQGYKWLVAK